MDLDQQESEEMSLQIQVQVEVAMTETPHEPLIRVGRVETVMPASAPEDRESVEGLQALAKAAAARIMEAAQGDILRQLDDLHELVSREMEGD